MESIEADDIGHADWNQLLFSKKPISASNKVGWNSFVLVAVAFLHIGVIGYLFQWRQLASPGMEPRQEALEITFIERAVTQEPATTASRVDKVIVPGKSRKRSSKDIVAMPRQAENNDDVSPASLRLTLDNDEWNVQPVITERNPLKRQHIALAGRAEPFMQGIKLRSKLSPQQKLAMVGKLFGAVEYDPCAEARKRLASGQSQRNEIDLEADLRAMENHCRP